MTWHDNAASALSFKDANGSVATGHGHFPVQNCSRDADYSSDDLCAENFDAFQSLREFQIGKGSGRGRQAMNMIAHPNGVLPPIDFRFAFPDFVRVTDVIGRLFSELEDSVVQCEQPARGKAGRHSRKSLGQVARSVPRSYWNDFAQGDRASVQSLVHAHKINAGLEIACHDRTLDWCSAAPSREQRRM
jgi:hypothetical protein